MTLTLHEEYMGRCLQLAQKGLGYVAPNPLVGCVLVSDGKVIAEGYHEKFGGPHAEVNAISNVADPGLLSSSTLYVNLEPCAHHGKTPPCADLIVQKGIPRVVVGTTDPFAQVSGKGISILRNAGIEVIEDVLKEECEFANRRFFTWVKKKRPYIILKWAQSLDGFMDRERREGEKGINWITGESSRQLVHTWRSKEAAILVGKNTALTDNPSLTVRKVTGRNPVRILIDSRLEVSEQSNIYNSEAPTIIFSGMSKTSTEGIEHVKVSLDEPVLPQVMNHLYAIGIQSVIVEGGAATINHFLQSGQWDEARVFTGPARFERGLRAPVVGRAPVSEAASGKDILNFYSNHG